MKREMRLNQEEPQMKTIQKQLQVTQSLSALTDIYRTIHAYYIRIPLDTDGSGWIHPHSTEYNTYRMERYTRIVVISPTIDVTILQL